MRKMTSYSSSKQEQRQSLVRAIIGFCIIILLLNSAIIIKRGYDSHQAALEEGKENIERLTHTISGYIELTFLAADNILKRSIERQYFNTLFGNNLKQDIQNNLDNWVKGTPQISAMLMTDSKGNITASSRERGYESWMKGIDNIYDNSAFQAHHLSDDPEQLYVGQMKEAIMENKEFIIISRSVSLIDGTFGGIVLVAVESNYIKKFFRAIEQHSNNRLVLMRDDMHTLINELSTDSDKSSLEEILVKQSPRQKTSVMQHTPEGEEMRIYAFDHIPSVQMLATVVTFDDDIFSHWRSERLNDLMFLGIFALFVLAISFFAVAVARQMQRVQRSERAAVLASQAKSDFLANMSHELRTPLNAIIGFSEMMAAGYFGSLNAKQTERIQDMNSCGNHLLSLINDILEFSKGEAGKIDLRNEKIMLPRIIKDVVRIMNEKARRDNIKLVAISADDYPMVLGDERKIKQILLNLVSNAMKFTESEGVIEVSCGLTEDNEPYFTVTDTGKGMKEAEIPKALSAFGQVHSDPTKGGTGLGLPLCKMFAELHGGVLAIQSLVGVGTKVTITLPAERVMTSQKISSENEEETI